MFRLEPAKITDIPSLKKIGKNSEIYTYSSDYYIYILVNFPDINFVIKNNQKEIIGFILTQIKKKPDSDSNQKLTFPIGHIVSFAVEEKYRNHGLGTQLMKKFLTSLKKKYPGVKQCYLETFVENKAIKLYQKYNFQITEILEKYYKDNDDDQNPKDGYLMISTLK
jgi:ribosomal protein S18 acetylase RimI-like enzyme